MRFEDEPYIKIYTSDSVTWSMLSWQAQGLLLCIMRKLDRAGILQLKGHDPALAIASVLHWPVDVVRETLPELREGNEPTLLVENEHLVQPRYIAGQMAKPTSTARTRAQRARQRDVARAQALGLDADRALSQDSLPSDLVPARKQSDIPDEPAHRSSGETGRPIAGRGVSVRDGVSQSETARDAVGRGGTLDQIRSDQRRGGVKLVVNQPAAEPAQIVPPPVETQIPDLVPGDVALVFEWLAAAQLRLRGRAHPEVYSQATEALVRNVLARTKLPLGAWREAIEGQYLDLRDKPQEKWRWLSLDTLAKAGNFRQARERYIVWAAAEEAKKRHADEQQARDEAEAQAHKRRVEREEAAADAAVEALDL